MAANVRPIWLASSGVPDGPLLLPSLFPLPLEKEENQNIPWELWSGFHNREPLSDKLRGSWEGHRLGGKRTADTKKAEVS